MTVGFEDIGRVWRDQRGDFVTAKVERLSVTLDRATAFDARTRVRMGIGAWLFLLVAFPSVRYTEAVGNGAPAVRAGLLLLAACAVLLVLWFHRIQHRAALDVTLPVHQALEAEVARLRSMERYGRGAPWLNALLAIGYFLTTFGAAAGIASPLGRLVACAWFATIFLAARLAPLGLRSSPIQTRREQLEEWLRGVEEGELAPRHIAGVPG